ncbi:slit homolog 3 protein-like [Limulus polyphemus]|uniref:Slit homolog 3 protein-like n=1 Tax=Limulus polyphemus TaxID=6850 RepID=A0ABM1BPB3_LIMPO|nr:slit homolog 3 protein-like [Limulus polyphemus]XP_022254319.1 slit homolog 3 protein-like [Limulus polyphemus]
MGTLELAQVAQPRRMVSYPLTVCTFIMLVKASVACPNACFCDENFLYVRCMSDGIWRVPLDIPKTVIRLELRKYIIPSLTFRNLEGFVQLKDLKLQQTQIKTINNETFLNLHALERLDLSQNLLYILKKGTFDGLLALRYLDISSNLLVSFDEAFRNLSSIEKLNLGDNRIPQLTVKSLTGLQNVRYLNLELNNISTIQMGAFQYLKNLVHLTLSNNPLITLTRLDFFGSRLQYIDISNSGIQHVPQSLTRFVRDLRLAKNNITYIRTGDLESYQYLGLLVLDDNNISEIENDALGRLEFLNRLWLNGNKLRSIPMNLPPCLQSLYMENNSLKELPSFSFQGLINLEHLYLQKNVIEYLHKCAFCNLFNLRSLDLQANKIKNLTVGVFEKLAQLETLNLSQNKIKMIGSRCFVGLDNLKTLQISHISSIIYFDELVFDTLKNLIKLELYDSSHLSHQVLRSTGVLHALHNVRELNIMHNDLTSLRSDFPSFFPNLEIIKMSGNKWHCNQSILWLQKWITTSHIQFYQSYDVYCSSPLQLQFKPIMLLTEKDLTIILNETSKMETKNDNLEKDDVKLYVTATQFPLTTNKSSGMFVPVYGTQMSVMVNKSQSRIWMTSNKSNLPGNSEAQLNTTEIKSYNETLNSQYILSSGNIDIHNMDANTTNAQTINTSSKIIQADNLTGGIENTLSSDNISNISALLAESLELTNFALQIYNTTESFYNYITKHEKISSHKKLYNSSIFSAHVQVHKISSNPTMALNISFSIAGGCIFVILGFVALVSIYRHWKFSFNDKQCQLQRNNSISYSPQKDEVSILTVTENTTRQKNGPNHELGNKLYDVMVNIDEYQDPATAVFPYLQFQELLPQTLDENGHILI